MVIDWELGKELSKKEISRRFKAHTARQKKEKSKAIEDNIAKAGLGVSLVELRDSINKELSDYLKHTLEKQAELFDEGLLKGVKERGPDFNTFKNAEHASIWESSRTSLKENIANCADRMSWLDVENLLVQPVMGNLHKSTFNTVILEPGISSN
jgi:hypothetical protein